MKHFSHPLSGSSDVAPRVFYAFLIVALVAGITVGFVLAKTTKNAGEPELISDFNKNSNNASNTSTQQAKVKVQKGMKIGSMTAKASKLCEDSAQGIIREDKTNAKGRFYLERPGGPSQYVYMTSSSVDLSLYLGVKVKVRGQTYESNHVGWFMDVCQMEVL